MSVAPRPGEVRIAELVATLSLAADLGLGQPMEHCLRQTVIALRLAELAGAGAEDREATYYAGRIGLGDATSLAISQEYEQWDGKGYLLWMAALATLMAYEKTGMHGIRAGQLAGVALLLVAAAAFTNPPWLSPFLGG